MDNNGRDGADGAVWLTADVQYTAAHHYEPSRAAFTDFEPFWQFVSGPLNAEDSRSARWTAPSVRTGSSRSPRRGAVATAGGRP